MADESLVELPMPLFAGDEDAQLIAGDVYALIGVFKGNFIYKFDDTNEMAIVSKRFRMPTQYAGGVVKAGLGFFMASDNTNDIALDVFIEAVTPDTDTIDLEATTGWDSANSGTVSLSGSTAGDPLSLTITLTNKDGVVAGDWVRVGIRRDTDSANDDAAGYLYLDICHLLETR
jgi:hypothetical protein